MREVNDPVNTVTYSHVGSGTHDWRVNAVFDPGSFDTTLGQWPVATLTLKVRGFADLHNHTFSYLGFGGKAFHGKAFGQIDQALPWCNHVHGPGGTQDLIGNLVRAANYSTGVLSTLGHRVGGNDRFDGWPRWDSITHQAVYEDWLKRAVDGGLRLIVALAVNNEYLCGLANKAPGRKCDDWEAVDLQLDEARAMEMAIDAKSGTGNGWFRIVTSPSQARKVMDEGKLAVVLGVEVDDPLACGYVSQPKCFAKVGVPPTECVYPNPSAIPLLCDRNQMVGRLDRWYQKGVRHLFPVHFADNAFGASALQNGLQWQVQRQADDNWTVLPVPAVPPPPGVASMTIQESGCQASTGHTYGGKCNARGLTSLGRDLVEQLMRRGMIIDIDHMSSLSKDAVFTIAERVNYPGLVSGHSGYISTSSGAKRHEGQLSDAELQRLRGLGGLTGLILYQGGIGEVPTWAGGGQTIPHRCGNSIETFAQAYLFATAASGQAVAFGTDFNGMIPPFGPRMGADACPGGVDSSAPINPPSSQLMPYPFVARATGVQMARSLVGLRLFDIANDGPAHIGMLPDLIADLEWIGVPAQRLEPLFESAEAYVRLWERAETVGRGLP